ncbi:MAG: hypothetical protein WC389_06540 [Lutibacter sp.]
MENNLEFYDKLRTVPAEAQKTIGAGRLKGFTDTNPMWRIKKLTETFGVCGIGWKYVITDQKIEKGGNNEQSAFVTIDLFVKIENEWSEAIPGVGGSSFVANEKAGLHTSDECFKMALTDAISVACKALGMGADIYYAKDATKYDNDDKKITLESIDEIRVALNNYYNEHNPDLQNMLRYFNLGSFDDFSSEQLKTIYNGLLERKKL